MISTVVKFALRDLRHGYRGFWIFFGCLALGVAAIMGVTTMSMSLLNGIERDGKLLLGGDIAVGQQWQDLSNEQRIVLEENTEHITRFVEMRTLMRTPDARNSILVSLKAVDDVYPLYGTFEINEGLNLSDAVERDGKDWGAVVDASIVESGRAEIGEYVSMGTASFRITGIIRNEPDRIGSSGSFAFWPRVIVHRDAIVNSGLLGEGSRSYFEYRLKLNEDVDLNQLTSGIAEKYPLLDVRDYHNASPNLSEVVQRLGVLLSLAGLTTLLIGGVGVSNAVRAYMDTRLSTIAIFKCVGASKNFVFNVYLTQTLLLSTIGIILGIAGGFAATSLSAAAIERMLSVPLALSFDLSNVLIVSTYGMLTALLFTLWPLACALNTTPAALFRNAVSNERQTASWRFATTSIVLAASLAIIVIATAHEQRFAIWFVIGVTLAWIAFRVISALIVKAAKVMGRPRSSTARLAITNLHRPGSSTSDIVLAIGLGLSVLIATAMVSANLDKQMNSLIPEKAPAFFFMGIQSSQLGQFKELVHSIDGVSDLTVLPYIPGRITAIKGMHPLDALVDEGGEWLIDDNGERAFSYTANPLDQVTMIEGDWWPSDYSGSPMLSVHKDVADSFALEIGDSITMNILGRDITGKVRNVRELEWRSMQLNFAIMLSPEPLRSIPHSSIGTVHVTEENEFVLQERVVRAFPNITVIRIKDALNRVNDLMIRGRNAARGISAVTIIAGVLVLTGIVISENRRRAYESVLLKTIGASRRYILTVFSLEYLLQGGITAVVAVLLGSLASWAVITVLMGWEWFFMPLSAVSTAILGLSISLFLGMMGIWRALKHRPLFYLRNE